MPVGEGGSDWQETFADARAQLSADNTANIVRLDSPAPCLIEIALMNQPSAPFNIRDLNVDVLNSVDFVENDFIQAYFVNVVAGGLPARVTFGSVHNARRFAFSMVRLARLCGSPMRIVAE
jgi:hypothetical protein